MGPGGAGLCHGGLPRHRRGIVAVSARSRGAAARTDASADGGCDAARHRSIGVPARCLALAAAADAAADAARRGQYRPYGQHSAHGSGAQGRARRAAAGLSRRLSLACAVLGHATGGGDLPAAQHGREAAGIRPGRRHRRAVHADAVRARRPCRTECAFRDHAGTRDLLRRLPGQPARLCRRRPGDARRVPRASVPGGDVRPPDRGRSADAVLARRPAVAKGGAAVRRRHRRHRRHAADVRLCRRRLGWRLHVLHDERGLPVLSGRIPSCSTACRRSSTPPADNGRATSISAPACCRSCSWAR